MNESPSPTADMLESGIAIPMEIESERSTHLRRYAAVPWSTELQNAERVGPFRRAATSSNEITA